jgi:hypothetical protein
MGNVLQRNEKETNEPPKNRRSPDSKGSEDTKE